eukprot:maker-scaffold758_size101577-snap-gene-0.20 protein:Tk05286 transcript:maker-scaffold758_size101577-snap-gene-0.20-mRNA-1 annotation:"amylase-binding protein"
MFKLIIVSLLVGVAWAWPHDYGFTSIKEKSTTCNFLDASPFFKTSTRETAAQNMDEMVLLTEFSRFMNAKAMDLLQEFAEIKKLYQVKKNFQGFEGTVNEAINHRIPRQFKDTSGTTTTTVPTITPATTTTTVPTTTPATTTTTVPTTTPATTTTTVPTTTPATTTITVPTTTPATTTTTVPTTTPPTTTTTTRAPPTTTTRKPLVNAAADTFNSLVANATAALNQLISSVGGAASSNTPSPIWDNICFLIWFPYHQSNCNQLRCTACAPSVMAADVVCKKASRGLKSTHKCLQNVMGEGRCNFCITDFLHA